MPGHWVYRFYSGAGQLLYIGYTSDPGVRFRHHAAKKPWWKDVAEARVVRHATRQEGLDAERTAILREQPRYNGARYETVGGKTPLRSARVSEEVWNAAKAQAAIDGRTLTDVIRQALVEYAEYGEEEM